MLYMSLNSHTFEPSGNFWWQCLCLDLWDAAAPGFPGPGSGGKPQVRRTKKTEAEEAWDTGSKERRGSEKGPRVGILYLSQSDTGGQPNSILVQTPNGPRNSHSKHGSTNSLSLTQLLELPRQRSACISTCMSDQIGWERARSSPMCRQGCTGRAQAVPPSSLLTHGVNLSTPSHPT